jgi:hypothetical protein
MVPVLALAASVLYCCRGAGCATHWTFALHFYGFALLILTYLFPLLGAAFGALVAHGQRASGDRIDFVATGLQTAVLGWYISRSSGRVYSVPLYPRIVLSLLAVLAVGAALFLHRIGAFFTVITTN